MAIEGAVSAADFGEGIADVSANALIEIGKIGNWLQAIGVVVIIWFVVQVVNFLINRRNHNTIKDLKKDVERLEKKIDKLGRKRQLS